MKKAALLIFSCFAIIAVGQLVFAYPSLKITANADITQQANTEKEYAVTVTNTGDALLEEVYLTVNFLPSRWYTVNENIHLPVGDSSVLHYKLSLPADAIGTIRYNVIANAVMGVGVVAQSSSAVELEITSPTSTSVNSQEMSTSTVQVQQNVTDYKWILVSILIGAGVIFAMAAYIFWND